MPTKTHTLELLPKQREFMEDTSPELLYSGAFGAGKTKILCEKAYFLSIYYPNNFGLIVRKTMNSLRHTTLRTLLKGTGDQPVIPPSAIANYNKSNNIITLVNGSEIIYGGLDDPVKWGSLEVGWIAIDEAVEINEDDYTMLLGRLRQANVPMRQIFMATNPGTPNHFLYKRFYQEQPVSKLDGSPLTKVLESNALQNTFNPADYTVRLDSFKGVYRERFVLGKWTAFEGLVYPVFDPTRHVIDPFEIPDDWRRVRVIDFGYVNPFVCYDDKTEILTENGWMLFPNVSDGVRVATINEDNKCLEWQKPISRIEQKYKGTMIRGKRKAKLGVDFCVTPNHKMVLDDSRYEKWGHYRADKMPKWRGIPTGWEPINKSDGNRLFHLPHEKPKRGSRGKLVDVKRVDFARFLGWWIGDGSLLKNNGGWYVRIAQKVDCLRLEACLDLLGWCYTKYLGANGVYDYRIQSRDLYEWLKKEAQWIPLIRKRIPSQVYGWGKDSLYALIDGLIASDGSDRPNATVAYYTTKKDLADDVQMLAVLLGIPTVIGEQGSIGGNSYGSNSSNHIWVVRFHKYNRAIVGRLNISEIEYDGVVYCFEVPNGTLVVRRNDRPMVCGNCQWWAIDHDDTAYMYREIYMSHRIVEDHARQIKTLTGSENIDVSYADHDAEDRATLQKYGISTVAARKNVSSGIQEVYSRLSFDERGKSRLYFFKNALVETDQHLVINKKPTCTVDEFAGYVWKDKGTKEEPVKEDDHGCDCVKYLCFSELEFDTVTDMSDTFSGYFD